MVIISLYLQVFFFFRRLFVTSKRLLNFSSYFMKTFIFHMIWISFSWGSLLEKWIYEHKSLLKTKIIKMKKRKKRKREKLIFCNFIFIFCFKKLFTDYLIYFYLHVISFIILSYYYSKDSDNIYELAWDENQQ